MKTLAKTTDETDSKIIPGVVKTPRHEKLVTKAIARYARVHNEYARTVRQNSDLYRAAVMEWNETMSKRSGS